jgi:hypothetical protein
MDIEDLKAKIEQRRTIEEAAQFLCGADSVEDVAPQGQRPCAAALLVRVLVGTLHPKERLHVDHVARSQIADIRANPRDEVQQAFV